MGVLKARLGVLEARLGVLEAGLGVLDARLSVLEARLGVLEGLLGGSNWSWAVPEPSGDVPGDSRARIIDFSLVFGHVSGGGAMDVHARAKATWSGLDPKISKTNQNP